jgi:hypothetical protein
MIMKTTKQVIADSGLPPVLVRAVVRTVGKDYLDDLMNHGASGGFPGITYYRDTLKFYKAHKRDILSVAANMADELGEDMLVMISRFNCLKDEKLSTYEVAQALGGRGDNVASVRNAMCWFACEEVARAFES